MEGNARITKDMLPAMQAVIPSVLTTCDLDGTPNVTYISQVFYVDDQHVALSFQFMNKTWKNINQNPLMVTCITCPETLSIWKLRLRFIEQTSSGDVFEEMDMQIAALASMSEREKNFKIQSALICKVESVEQIYKGD
jgi:uncharacterized protein